MPNETERLVAAAATGERVAVDYGDLLEWQASVRPHATAVILDDRVLTFAQLRGLACAAAAELVTRGMRPGDRVGLLGANTVEWLALALGALRNGYTVVPINARYANLEVTALTRRAQLRLLVAQPRFGRKDLGGYLSDLFVDEGIQILTFGGDVPGLPGLTLAPAGEATPGGSGRYASSVGMIMYTSGSTSAPKGCMLTQAGMIRNAALHTNRLGIDAGDRWFSPMPFYHAGGFVWGVTSMLVTGAPLISQEIFQPEQALDLIERTQATYHHGVDTMFVAEMESPSFDVGRVRSLRVANSTGGPAILERIHQTMAVPGMVSKWGITEGYGNLTLSAPDDPPGKRLGTVGRGYPGIEYRINDATVAGGPGEILIRGSVMEGYFRDGEATAAIVDGEGWLHTGDLGAFDEQGYLHYSGRIKQMLKVGGENVSALEVEGLLLTHPGVTAVAVIGVSHPRLGEVPIAVVQVSDPSSRSTDQLMAFCVERLAKFKVPAEIVVVGPGEFPLTGSGKADSAKVRQLVVSRS